MRVCSASRGSIHKCVYRRNIAKKIIDMGADRPNLSEIDGGIQSASICEVWHATYSIKVGRRAFIMKSFYSENTVVAYRRKEASHNDTFAPSCKVLHNIYGRYFFTGDDRTQ